MINNQVLTSLYYGKINPWESKRTVSKECEQEREKTRKLIEDLESSLDVQGKKLLNEFIYHNDNVFGYLEEQRFIDGFKLGCQLAFEVVDR